ncbi:MAG: HAMP domain-containing sensor histidine kinase [Desulfobulbales bacterium]
MKWKWPWSGSIAQRIKWAFYVLMALVVLGLILSWVNMGQISTQIAALKTTSGFLDTVLEIRRYEKNWIIYRDVPDFNINQEKVAEALNLLEDHEKVFSKFSPKDTIHRLQGIVTNYRALMQEEIKFMNSGQGHHLLEKIRKEGHEMVTVAESLDNATRQSITATLNRITMNGFGFILFVAIVAFFLGKQLTISVVKPLNQIVECTKEIASGDVKRCDQLKSAFDISEINAVLSAFEVMLTKLEHREKLAIQTEKMAALGTLVAGVAHELNNPLSNAGTSAQILLEEMHESDLVPRQFQIEMLEQITEQTDRARKIVKSLLEFSREKTINPLELKISDLVHHTMEMVLGEIPAHTETKVIVEKDGVFWGDKLRLQQALVNLLLNAFQAAGDGAIIILRGNFDTAEHQVRLEVEDNGPGIPPEIITSIFDPYFTTKDVGQGSGLGLAITHEIITKHGGKISVESELKKGTRFVITLPTAKCYLPETTA